jgi:hypothetical protein
VPYFGSPCPAQGRTSRILVARLIRLESRTKTPYQMPLINRLTKITNDTIVRARARSMPRGKAVTGIVEAMRGNRLPTGRTLRRSQAAICLTCAPE